MKRCFILLSHFVVVKDFKLFWTKSHLLSFSLMLEYLTILFQIFFALNEQKKVKLVGVRNWKLYLKAEKYKTTFCFKFLSVCMISLYRKPELQQRFIIIGTNKSGKVWFHSTILVKLHECSHIFKTTFFRLIWTTASNVWAWLDNCKDKILTLQHEKVSDKKYKYFPKSLIFKIKSSIIRWERYHQLRYQSYTEHRQGDNWCRKKEMDQDRSILVYSRVNRTLRRWHVLWDNSYSATTKKRLNKKKHLTINGIKINFLKKTGSMLYPVKRHLMHQEL